MKSPRTPISHLLFNSKFSRNHENKSLSHSSPTSKLQNPQRFHLFCTKILPTSSLTPRDNKLDTIHSLDSTNQPKPTIKITSFVSFYPKNESFFPQFLYPIKKSKPIFKTFGFDQMAPKFNHERSFSSSPSDPFNSDHIDAGSSIRKPISLWPGMYDSPVTNALWEARSSLFERPANASEKSSQNELISKPPSKSRTSILYKFSTDYILREQYRNPWNEIRIGKLLEDLDALAGTISFKHCSGNDSSTRSLILVTASVDKMVLRKPIRVDSDVTIAGAVTWVGRSSMEIQLEVNQSSKDKSESSNDDVALTANFTFVARDSETGKSAQINQISPETEKEKLLWNEAEERNKLRKMKKGEGKKGISDEEVSRLNELLSEGRVFCDMPALANRDSILIKDTCLQNSLMCQPQQRNIHGRIFGGFLMRRAFELAFATAYSFAGSSPCFVEVDHVDFLKPVDVGNFLRFNSCVLFTELENPSQPLINVEVVAHVMMPEHRSTEVSNKFYFTFTVHSDALRNGQKIRNVVPATEEEARRVIERMDAERSSL